MAGVQREVDPEEKSNMAGSTSRGGDVIDQQSSQSLVVTDGTRHIEIRWIDNIHVVS